MRAWKKLAVTAITVAASAWISSHVPLAHDQQLWVTASLTGLLSHLLHVDPKDQVLGGNGE